MIIVIIIIIMAIFIIVIIVIIIIINGMIDIFRIIFVPILGLFSTKMVLNRFHFSILEML